MKPLIEINDTIDFFTEGKDNEKNLYLRGISIQAEIVNGNKRKYPYHVAESAVNLYIEQKLSKDIASGELDHPKENISKINPDRISHKFIEVIRDGNNWITKARILDTICGKQVKNLVDGGIKLGMSSRGFGKTNNSNGVAIVEDLYLVSLADIVIDPSAPDAWQQAVYEDKEWIFENGLLVEKDVEPIMDDVKKALNKLPKKEIKKYCIKKFAEYINIISKK